MTRRILALVSIVLAAVAIGLLACATSLDVRTRRLDPVERLEAPRVCPDGEPVRLLEHPTCGRSCGYSCLPDRWRTP